jgi:uncharacterized membrane protein
MASFVRTRGSLTLLFALVACSFDERDLDERSGEQGGEGGGSAAAGGDAGNGGVSGGGRGGSGGGAGASGSAGVSGSAGSSGAATSGGSAGTGGAGASGGGASGAGADGSGGASGSSAGTPDNGDGGVPGEAGSSSGGAAGMPGTDPCQTNPCANGGICVADGDATSCMCQGGFAGPTCSTAILSVLPRVRCRAQGVSGTGTLIAGSCLDESGSSSAFTWTGDAGDEAVTLPPYRGTEAGAFGVDRNGFLVVGWSDDSSGQRRAARWLSGSPSTYQTLTTLEYYHNVAYRTDADGSVTVGVSQRTNEYDTAVRWSTTASAPTNCESGGPHESSFARGVSADGSLVVAYGTDEGGAFTWSESTGYLALAGLEGATDNQALGVSDDGNVIVGRSGNVAVRWVDRVSRTPESLGSLGRALSANADGSAIVGEIGAEAFVWTESDGIRTLVAELLSHDVELGGFVPVSATDVSDDGTVIVGYGTLNGTEHAFRVTLPAL